MTPDDRELLDELLPFVTPRRRERFMQILRRRTRHLTVALEDVYQPHNVSAVLRSCDAFGVQDVHVIESRNAFQPHSRIALGSQQWLTIRRYESTAACLAQVRAAGYRVVAASPDAAGASLEEIDLRQPLALFLGAEKEGLSADVLAAADESVTIPMWGFVQSFNVSVAAALCLYTLTRRLRACRGVDWPIPESEHPPILLEWCRNTIPHVEQIEARLRNERRQA